jgi:hypothetical protein
MAVDTIETTEAPAPPTDAQAAAILKGFDPKAVSLIFWFAQQFQERAYIEKPEVDAWFLSEFPTTTINKLYAWMSALTQRAQAVIGRELITVKKGAEFVEEDGVRRRAWRTRGYEGRAEDFQALLDLIDPLWGARRS